jgi:hypothetical protein
MVSVFLIHPDPNTCSTVGQLLADEGHTVYEAGDFPTAH